MATPEGGAMWNLFIPEISIAEKILRSGVVYLFLLLAFRFTGKRQVGQLTPFDLVVLLIISNVVQNAVIGNDNSLGGGLIGAVTILALNYGVTEMAYRSKRARRLLEAQPTLLIHNGRILEENGGISVIPRTAEGEPPRSNQVGGTSAHSKP